MTERNKGLITTILWVLAAAYAVALVANIAFGLGIPIAVLGMAWFMAMVALNLPAAWRSGAPAVTIARLGLAVGGMGFALYLVSAELLSINAICLWCSLVHVLTFALFVLVVAGTSRLGLALPSSRVSP